MPASTWRIPGYGLILVDILIQHFRQQRTLARPARFEGTGYWTGERVTIKLCPAAVNTGLVFIRNDLQPPRRILASVATRTASDRRTCLTGNGATVEMVEHVLAGLAGLQVDNCEIIVNRNEMPALDGSSLAVVAAIESAGIVQQDAPRPCIVVEESIRVGEGDRWLEAQPTSETGLTIEYQLDYGPGPIGAQTVIAQLDPDTFGCELAPARTFLLQSEAESLQARGLGRSVTFQDLLVFGPDGPIDNSLRCHDECGRHKALDIVGDLALTGCDIQAKITAHKSGHRQNAQMAAAFHTLMIQGRSLRHSA